VVRQRDDLGFERQRDGEPLQLLRPRPDLPQRLRPPLMRMTFDYKDNEHKMGRHIAGVMTDLAKSMNPTSMNPAVAPPSPGLSCLIRARTTPRTIMGSNRETARQQVPAELGLHNLFIMGASGSAQFGYNPTGPVGALGTGGRRAQNRYMKIRDRWCPHSLERTTWLPKLKKSTPSRGPGLDRRDPGEGALRRGLKVVALERGGQRSTEGTSGAAGARRAALRGAPRPEMNTQKDTSRCATTFAGSVADAQAGSSPGDVVGGSGVHWSGHTWRWTDMEFRCASLYEERYGKKHIPEDMTIQDWASATTSSNPTRQVRVTAAVSGKAGNIAQSYPAWNPFERRARATIPAAP